MLINYLPPAVSEIKEMKEICKAEQPFFDDASQEIENILCRVFISKADEKGIKRFEEEYGIIPGDNQTLEERRVNILIRTSKKNLSLADVTNLLYNYSDEIGLLPDYNEDILTVIVGDQVNNILTIYKTLDDLISMQVYIRFAMQLESKLEFVQNPTELKLESTVIIDDLKQTFELFLEFVSNLQIENNVELIKEKNAWYLEGSVNLDGSRTLSAERYEEEL